MWWFKNTNKNKSNFSESDCINEDDEGNENEDITDDDDISSIVMKIIMTTTKAWQW